MYCITISSTKFFFSLKVSTQYPRSNQHWYIKVLPVLRALKYAIHLWHWAAWIRAKRDKLSRPSPWCPLGRWKSWPSHASRFHAVRPDVSINRTALHCLGNRGGGGAHSAQAGLYIGNTYKSAWCSSPFPKPVKISSIIFCRKIKAQFVADFSKVLYVIKTFQGRRILFSHLQ